MTATDHRALMNLWSEVITSREWDRFAELVQPDAVLEYPQSGERFRGIANIRATFAEYPDLGAGSTHVDEVIGSPTAYALTPSYTLIAIDGSGDTGAAVSRVHIPGRDAVVCAPPLRAAGRPAEQDPRVLRPRLRSSRLASAIPRGAVASLAFATDELSRAGSDDPGMDQQPHLVSVNARLGSQELGIEVAIRLRDLDGRWLAVAEFGGEPEVGIGATPRAALIAALGTLGERTAAALMADPQLFGVSAAIRRPPEAARTAAARANERPSPARFSPSVALSAHPPHPMHRDRTNSSMRRWSRLLLGTPARIA